MIQRFKLHILGAMLFLATAMASPVAAGSVYSGMSPHAQETAENVIETLESRGYRIVSIRRTFLRRFRITASNGVRTREVIVSRSTGEIRSDSVFLNASIDDDAVRTSAISNDDGDNSPDTGSKDSGYNSDNGYDGGASESDGYGSDGNRSGGNRGNGYGNGGGGNGGGKNKKGGNGSGGNGGGGNGGYGKDGGGYGGDHKNKQRRNE